MSHRNRTLLGSTPLRTLVRRSAGPLLVAGLLALPCSLQSAEARGGPAAPKPATPASRAANAAMGAQIFDRCIQWVAAGQRGITRTTDFHIAVMAELDLDTARHRGPMRLWWKSPDKYRQELTTNKRTTTKILNGDFMWIVHPSARVQRMHGTSEGAGAIRQLKEDRERMADLAQFITLQSLKGPGVTFEFGGERTGSGSYAGTWLKLTRRAPGAAVMHFWIAFDKDAQGRYLPKYPGVVRIDGDARKKIPTEDFILGDWVSAPQGQPHTYRYPRGIEAYSRLAGQAPVRFLKATVTDIRINTGIQDTRFKPPLPSGR
ncbi:MAG: hypothetical protein P1V36_12280 [Planctomycetota bacterium]|nr:hypothetical protein [Planctomycetota bacterium]